ncbi:MAG: Na+/H+ antiporter subunit B, partial [Phycisphaerales bacterium]
MKSTILRTATRFLLPLLLLFALVIFLQGHNKPGGGFVGGLVAAAAFSLHALAFDARETRRMLVVDLRTLIGAGLLVALASAIMPLFVGQPFFKGLWTSVEIGGNELHLGTPLLFDLGVFLLVVGVARLIVL